MTTSIFSSSQMIISMLPYSQMRTSLLSSNQVKTPNKKEYVSSSQMITCSIQSDEDQCQHSTKL